MSEAPFQANDPTQVKKKQHAAKLRREQHETDLRELLALPSFRRYVWRHMHETCGLLRSAFSPNGSTQTLNIGMQDVARVMWAEVEQIDASMIPLMMTEHREANNG